MMNTSMQAERTYITARLSAERATLPEHGVQKESPAWRRVYALGCWLALEHLCDRLTNGNAILCQMQEKGEQGTKRFDRLSVAWLKLGFRSIALIGRMGWADPHIEQQFCQSPTGQYFADTEWPDAPPTCDVNDLLVQSRLVA